MKIAITLSNNELNAITRLTSVFGGKTNIKKDNRVSGNGPFVSETKVKEDGIKFTTKIDERFFIDIYQVIENHAQAIIGFAMTVKGLWSTYMALCKGIEGDIKSVVKKHKSEKE